MERLAILALLEARPGQEDAVEAFLKSALLMAELETETVGWYALKLGTSTFAIFDTFADALGREKHLSGELATALFARADEFFATPPTVGRAEILARKASAA